MTEEIKRQVEERVEEERKAAKPEDSNKKELSIKHIIERAQQGQMGAALLLFELHPDKIAFIKNESRFILFKDFWKFDQHDEIHSYIFDVIDAFAKAYETVSDDIITATKAGNTDGADSLQGKAKILLKRIKNLQDRRYMKNVIAFVGDFAAKPRGIFDKKPYHLRCGFDLVDLKTGIPKPCEPGDYVITGCETPYREDAKEPRRFIQFLYEVSNNRLEWVQGLQIILGLSLIGKIVEEILVIFLGPLASNGKTILFEILQYVLGDLAISFNLDMLLYNKFRGSGGPNPDLLDLNGRRLAFGNEAPDNSFFAPATMKRVTSPGVQTGRRCYDKENTTFEGSHTIFLATNTLPHAPSFDEGFFRRVITIPFDRKFVSEPKAKHELLINKNILQELKKESTEILTWLVRGCLIYQEVGLVQPECFLKETKKYRDSEDLLKEFIDEYCDVDPDLVSYSSELFAAFLSWYELEISSKGCSQRFFGLLMGKKFNKYREKGAGLTVYEGIKLKEK